MKLRRPACCRSERKSPPNTSRQFPNGRILLSEKSCWLCGSLRAVRGCTRPSSNSTSKASSQLKKQTIFTFENFPSPNGTLAFCKVFIIGLRVAIRISTPKYHAQFLECPSAASFQIDAGDQLFVFVENVNVAGTMIANPPNKHITAAPDFARLDPAFKTLK